MNSQHFYRSSTRDTYRHAKRKQYRALRCRHCPLLWLAYGRTGTLQQGAHRPALARSHQPASVRSHGCSRSERTGPTFAPTCVST